MSKGKDYEIFVKNLQQAILNSEEYAKQKNIEIELNKKIIDNSGIEREFDLYWEYELAGIEYKTVIECKNYKSKISVDNIDALIGKIKDIPDLKPVFATKTGYQKGAETKARHNRIVLLIVREQRDEDWQTKDGTPLFREVNIQIICDPCPRITRFNPYIDRSWVEKNTELKPENLSNISGTNNEIFIEDLVKSETYSLYDLADRLGVISCDKYGELIHKESFKDAYLVHHDLRLKMTSYELEYVNSKPISIPLHINFAKELRGIIEYVHKNSSTAIFKDKIVKDWK